MGVERGHRASSRLVGAGVASLRRLVESPSLRPKLHTGVANATVAPLVVLFFLACHGAPAVMHQSAHVGAAGTHHEVAAHAAADHAGGAEEASGAQTQDAAQSGFGMADTYAAAFLALALGAAMLIAAISAAQPARRGVPTPAFAPPRPRWRPPPPPTPVRLQVFRL